LRCGAALEAFQELSRVEGIIPSLETAHAIAYVSKVAPTTALALSAAADLEVARFARVAVRYRAMPVLALHTLATL